MCYYIILNNNVCGTLMNNPPYKVFLADVELLLALLPKNKTKRIVLYDCYNELLFPIAIGFFFCFSSTLWKMRICNQEIPPFSTKFHIAALFGWNISILANYFSTFFRCVLTRSIIFACLFDILINVNSMEIFIARKPNCVWSWICCKKRPIAKTIVFWSVIMNVIFCSFSLPNGNICDCLRVGADVQEYNECKSYYS